jgi:hypothetical protein
MGQAKQKREELKKLVLHFINEWDFPATEHEARAVEEIRRLPQLTVRRYSEAQLAYMRMKPNQCHANAQFMEDNDPERKCKRISGYLIESGNYVLHSVVERDGDYFCVTPVPTGGPSEFLFIPDYDIEWRVEGDKRVATRKGCEIKPGFRSDPEETKRISSIIRARIEDGIDPIKAGLPPFEDK